MSEPGYSKYRWAVIASLCAVQAVTVAVLVAPATLVGDIARDMGLSLGMTTGVTMVFHNIFVAVSAIFGGVVIDRFGPYRVWVGGMTLFILALLFMPAAGHNLFGMLAIRAIHGIGAGPIMSTAPLVVAQWSPSRQRGVVIGIQGTFVSIGAVISMICVPYLFERTGSWQFALMGVGGFAVMALILGLMVSLGPAPPGLSPVRESSEDNPRDRQRGKARLFVRMPATWAAALCSFWFSWAIRMVYDIVPNYLAMEPPTGIGMGAVKAGRIMTVVHIVSMLGSVASGILMEKFFRGRPRGLVAIGFLFSTLLWLPMGFPDIFTFTLFISFCLWTGGIAISLTFPLVLTFVSKCYPECVMGEISGLMTGFSTFGTLVGLAAGACALHLTGAYHVTIVFISAGTLLGFMSALFLKKPNKKHTNKALTASKALTDPPEN